MDNLRLVAKNVIFLLPIGDIEEFHCHGCAETGVESNGMTWIEEAMPDQKADYWGVYWRSKETHLLEWITDFDSEREAKVFVRLLEQERIKYVNFENPTN